MGRTKRCSLCLKEPSRKSYTTFLLTSHSPGRSPTATLGTKEAGKYMVPLNPGSDSQEKGIMDEEVGR